MRFEDLDGILFGTISVIMPERGYIISFDDPSHAIEAYGEREVVGITGNTCGSDKFEDSDICYEGLVIVELGS